MDEREFTHTPEVPPPGEADTYEVPAEEEPEAEDEAPAGEDEPDEPEAVVLAPDPVDTSV